MPMDERYEPRKIEPKWQAEWERAELYLTREDRDRPKFYVLEMFPYPSGEGLSVGHLHNYVPCDVIGRFKRMTGYNVLHAMGWDAFGLPAENDALLKGLHPKETVPRYAANFKRQLKMFGCAYDWTREINSSTPEYYKWTQWFFLLLLQARPGLPRGRLAMVVRKVPHHPRQRAGDQRMLLAAHRHAGHQEGPRAVVLQNYRVRRPPARRPRRHRLARADQADAAQLDRPLRGRGAGFPVNGHPGKEVRFFTTRPDTVFGVSFMVLAPEHPLVAEITTPQQRAEVEAYVAQARRQSEIERLSTVKEKTGVFTGAYAHNVFTGKTSRSGSPTTS